MSKKDDLKNILLPLIKNKEKLEKFLLLNSNLPGPRSNLELIFALSEIYENEKVLIEWSQISEEQADTNDPKSFLVVCSLVCFGMIYAKNKDKKLLKILMRFANDGRWRVREGVAFGFQIIGESDFSELCKIFDEWIISSNNYEKRAILVSLAHPNFLNKQNAVYCLKIADNILSGLNNEDGIDVLKKGLEFTISVFTAANEETGFKLFEKWIGKNKIIDKILRENLKKNRIRKLNNARTEQLLKILN